ncbi:MAG: D-tyrosyl-tRNA(Tyr) deacylase [Candidatus Woesebacteria bacterium]|nr:MAG: D-tyrosyl-tRNA(Tyr) deacylase [Candidatus Woesebacteria bacterium]
MKLVVQRVKKAKVVRVSDKKTVGEIGLGLFVLVGFKKGDTNEAVKLLADKLSKLRVMSDDQEKMNKSINEVGGKILVVSQFTLYADTKGGNRPSFINAEEPEKAKKLYEYLISKLRELSVDVETGSFGDYMQIEALLDGPVTILFSE